jgi:PAS domain S-box-containing protein
MEIVRNREKYRLLLQNFSDAVVVHSIVNDRPAPFIEVNDQACQMPGYPREKLLALTLADIADPGQEERIALIMRVLSEKRYSLYEIGLVAKDGHRIRAEISAQMFDLKGTPVVISIIRDITKNRVNRS